MADNAVKSKKYSSRLLGMKFMQRSMEKEQQQELERERKRIISEAEWTIEYEAEETQKSKINVEYQPSYLAFTEINAGRQSFKEFNKAEESDESQEQKSVKKEGGDDDDDELIVLGKSSINRSKTKSAQKRQQKQMQGGEQDSRPKKMPKKQGFIKPE